MQERCNFSALAMNIITVWTCHLLVCIIANILTEWYKWCKEEQYFGNNFLKCYNQTSVRAVCHTADIKQLFALTLGWFIYVWKLINQHFSITLTMHYTVFAAFRSMPTTIISFVITKLTRIKYVNSMLTKIGTQRSPSLIWIIDSHHFHSMSISPPISEIRLFQTLTLKIRGHGNGYVQKARSHIGPSIQLICSFSISANRNQGDCTNMQYKC